ncbi:MAG: D-alanyl-D-alanine carboxypeptidase [Oscillospiraceae bacterium]|nr:D-alanyl-D-alanine carboxypeptidase [Oscillospiraceae bacterium]
MKKIQVLSLLLALVLLTSALAMPAWAADDQTESTAASTEVPWADDPSEYRVNLLDDAPEYNAGCDTALLLELNSGIVVYAKNAEETVYPASLTKIMTCLVALKYAGDVLDTMKVTVSETAVEGIADAGGIVRLKVGETMSLRNCLYYLMVVSSNEAANVIAEAVGGSVPDFVNMMNETAKSLGCTGTHFTNPHGLHDSSHYTTARDMSIITRQALTYETFREITSTAEYTVPATNLSDAKRLTTTNYLILADGNRYLSDDNNYYTYYYDKASGIKTGYTSAAGRCVISRATDGNLDLLCIIMGADTLMMSDGSTRYDSFVQAKRLFIYGFDNFAYAKLAFGGDQVFPAIPAKVQFADDDRGVVLIPASDINCLLPKDYDRELVTYDYSLDPKATSEDGKQLVAPLNKGQKVGSLRMYYDGELAGETDLITLTDVQVKEVEKVITDITGTDKPLRERSTFQKILHYWYVPVLILAGLFLILVLRNVAFRALRRRELRKKRERAARRQAMNQRDSRR